MKFEERIGHGDRSLRSLLKIIILLPSSTLKRDVAELSLRKKTQELYRGRSFPRCLRETQG